MEDCESLFTHLKNRKLVTEKYLIRHSLCIQQFFGDCDLDSEHWLPVVANPADGLTKLKSETGQFLPSLKQAVSNPAFLRSLKGLASSEQEL